MPVERRICLGEITAVHGVRGEVRIRTFTEAPEDVAAYGPVEDEAGSRAFDIVQVRVTRDGVIARLAGIDDRNAAEALKGMRLYVDRARLPEQDAGVWYHADLIGLVAINVEGAALGQVVAVQNFGAGDLLEIRPATGGETVLVPFTEEIVPEIDVAAGWLLLRPPEGLFPS